MDTISWEWPIYNKNKIWGINDSFKPTNVFAFREENESKTNNGNDKPNESLQYSDVMNLWISFSSSFMRLQYVVLVLIMILGVW